MPQTFKSSQRAFFPILLSSSPPPTPFHSPLPVSFIFAPIPPSFLMCNISRRSQNERMMKRRVYSGVEREDERMMGWGWGRWWLKKTRVKITLLWNKSKSTLSNCFASNGKKQIHMVSHHFN